MRTADTRVARWPSSIKAKLFFTGALLVPLMGCVSLALFIRSGLWQRWDFDAAWNSRVVASFERGRVALENYREREGHYPARLEDVVTLPPPPPHHDSGKCRWNYEVLPDGEYQIYVEGQRGLSSYDALVYRSSQIYPLSRWEAKAFCLPSGKWLYVVGFSQLRKAGLGQQLGL